MKRSTLVEFTSFSWPSYEIIKTKPYGDIVYIRFLWLCFVVIESHYFIKGFNMLTQAYNMVPEPANLNSMSTYSMYHNPEGVTHTFILQDVDTGKVWLHEVENAPKDPKEVEAKYRSSLYRRWGDNIVVIGMKS